ncbi:cytochrome oxidase assembly protein [Paenibacillus alvei DSM 29]|nr:cytochrome oxidase assembly protein [Paenibacillus alvei DSM 29]
MNGNIYRILKRLSYAVCIGMFIVVLNGALVTKTGSGSGCGTDWPLCNGKFVPAYTIESMIEYSHRSVTGVVGLLVLALFIYVIRYAKHHREALCYSSLTLLFTVIQAIMGALAVVYTQSPPVMALHFGFSLLAFASSFMMSVVARRYERGSGAVSADSFIRAEFRYGVWFTLLYTYIVIYVGAFVRHTDSSGACMGWPLCNGEWIPELSGERGLLSCIVSPQHYCLSSSRLCLILLTIVTRTIERFNCAAYGRLFYAQPKLQAVQSWPARSRTQIYSSLQAYYIRY